MQGDLAKQLDLAIYELPDTFWWYQPKIIAGVFAIVLGIACVYAWYWQRKKRHVAVKIPEQLRELLRVGMMRVQEGRLPLSGMLVLLTSVLKSYTAWRCEYDAVHAMTDEQWLAYIKQVAAFKSAVSTCELIVHKMSDAKFAYGQISQKELQQLVDQVLKVIAETLPKTSSQAG